MPYTIRKLPNKSCYRVTNQKTKRVYAKCTTKSRAKKQIRLLNAIEYGKGFVPRNRTRKVSNVRTRT
jgi:hypothetical protein